MNKTFYFQNTYARLSAGSIVAMTAKETEVFLLANPDSMIMHFYNSPEASPAIFSNYPAKKKRIDISTLDPISVKLLKQRELSDCYEPVLLWLHGIDGSVNLVTLAGITL